MCGIINSHRNHNGQLTRYQTSQRRSNSHLVSNADNQVVCVTGGYGGIGYETTKAIPMTNPMLMVGFAIAQCHSLHCGEVSGKS